MRRALGNVWRPLAASSILAILLTSFLEYSSRTRGIEHSTNKLTVTAVLVAASFMYFWSLADASRRPAADWKELPLNKVFWLAALVFLPWVSLLVYVVYLRPRLVPEETSGVPRSPIV